MKRSKLKRRIKELKRENDALYEAIRRANHKLDFIRGERRAIEAKHSILKQLIEKHH